VDYLPEVESALPAGRLNDDVGGLLLADSVEKLRRPVSRGLTGGP